MNKNNNVLYLSHGGGPLPVLGDIKHREMIDTLKLISKEIEKPSAIIVFSAHWEESIVTILSNKSPSLLYDYYGFPEEAYKITYQCNGNYDLAKSVKRVFDSCNIESEFNSARGLDHGVFIPLLLMYPEADIPCIQISLLKSLNPEDHIKIGKALQNLKIDNLLIIGSGFSFHNITDFFSDNSSESKMKNRTFEKWLINTCTETKFSKNERENKMVNWDIAPFARFCHPREEHLLPLHICIGLTERACDKYYSIEIMDRLCSFYLWQDA